MLLKTWYDLTPSYIKFRCTLYRKRWFEALKSSSWLFVRKSRPVSSIGRELDCESGDSSSIPGWRWSLSLWLIMKSFLRSFALYCSGMYRRFSSLRKWRQLVLVNCLTACPGTIRWLNCALVNSMWLTAVIRSEKYQHHLYLIFWYASNSPLKYNNL
jgi:hypothetical protein